MHNTIIVLESIPSSNSNQYLLLIFYTIRDTTTDKIPCLYMFLYYLRIRIILFSIYLFSLEESRCLLLNQTLYPFLLTCKKKTKCNILRTNKNYIYAMLKDRSQYLEKPPCNTHLFWLLFSKYFYESNQNDHFIL